MAINIPKLIFSLGLCLGAGVLGSIFTVSSIPTWYQSLNKPFFSPPNWLFGPVWTMLYLMMGTSLYLILISKEKTKRQALNLFYIQLGLNALWSMIFFGLKNPTLALVEIVVLWVAIILTIKALKKINKVAANLLFPYLLWVTFATFLNLSIVLLN